MAVALALTGCASKPVVSAHGQLKSQRMAAPPALITAGTPAERFDRWRQELEEYKTAQREQCFRLQQKRLAEQHAPPPEMPEVKLVSDTSTSGSGPLTAADRADAWQRENAELLLAEQLREVRLHQLKARQHLRLPPERMEERSTP